LKCQKFAGLNLLSAIVPIFFIRRLGSRRVYQKEKKKGGVVIKKIGDGKYCAKSSDVI
jgi:hypothetical protein